MTWRPSRPLRAPLGEAGCRGHNPAHCQAHLEVDILEDDQTANEDDSQTEEKVRENMNTFHGKVQNLTSTRMH